MSETDQRLADQARDLRLAFDRSFAERRSRQTASLADMVAFCIGAEPYALRLSEIAGLFADRKVTSAPGGALAFMGLCSVRGVLAPVYDLHLLLGRAPIEAPRWLALAAGAPIALAFEVFDGHLRVEQGAIAPAGDRSQRLVGEFASVGGVVRPIVRLASVIEAVAERLPAIQSARGA